MFTGLFSGDGTGVFMAGDGPLSGLIDFFSRWFRPGGDTEPPRVLVSSVSITGKDDNVGIGKTITLCDPKYRCSSMQWPTYPWPPV